MKHNMTQLCVNLLKIKIKHIHPVALCSAAHPILPRCQTYPENWCDGFAKFDNYTNILNFSLKCTGITGAVVPGLLHRSETVCKV